MKTKLKKTFSSYLSEYDNYYRAIYTYNYKHALRTRQQLKKIASNSAN